MRKRNKLKCDGCGTMVYVPAVMRKDVESSKYLVFCEKCKNKKQ